MWVQFNTKFDTMAALRLSVPLVIAPVLLLAWATRRLAAWPRTQGTVPARIFVASLVQHGGSAAARCSFVVRRIRQFAAGANRFARRRGRTLGRD